MKRKQRTELLLEHLYLAAGQQQYRLDELLASQRLSPLFTDGYPYLPQTQGSVDNHSLLILVNDIVLHWRQSIIEFGSGVSTIVIGRLIRKNGLDVRLVSVENDARWAKTLRVLLKEEGLDRFVEIVTAPLEPIAFLPEHAQPWYSTAILDREIGQHRFDMVIVDGPIAFRKEIELARRPAVHYIKDRLADDFGIFLHDADRAGEQSILQEWDELLGIKNRQFTPKLSGYLPYQHLNIAM